MRILILTIAILVATVSCTSQIYLDPTTLGSVVEKKELKFNANRAYPTNNEVIGVMNSLPGGGSARILNLDSGFGLSLKKDSLSVYLPYFGRAYRSDYGNPNNSGLRFESKDFSVKQSATKKGNTLLVIKPNDQKANMILNLEIFKNGSAFLSISSDDRQPISFDGNISKMDD